MKKHLDDWLPLVVILVLVLGFAYTMRNWERASCRDRGLQSTTIRGSVVCIDAEGRLQPD